jgi:pilus assembly protein FimV
MTNKSRLLLGLLMAAPGMAYALGLGDIKLGSALNQPLVAEIELVGATPEELAQLRAGLASRESFERYGIDRPQYLSQLTFSVRKDAGRSVLEVRSQSPITEPFMTFLVEVNWPRGRLIREYTVLLDPPVFEQKATVAPPVAAPRTGETTAPAAGAVNRTPAPAPTPAEAPTAPAETSAAPRAGGEYRVVSGDTLSGIARRQGAASKGEINRLMIGIYRANPGAFDGNINRLTRGAVLRIPGTTDLDALSAREAAAEVRRQMQEWKGAGTGTAGGGETARLKLVTPTEPVPGVGTAPAPAAGAGKGGTPGATGADKKAADAKRLLELKNEELARAQGQKPAPTPAAKPGTATPTPPAAVAPATTPPAEATPPAAEAPKPKPAHKPKAVTPPPAEPSLLDTLTDNLIYVLGGGVALLLAGFLGFRTLQKRREAETDDAFRTLDRGGSAGAPSPSLSTTARLTAEAERTNILVEEGEDDSGEFKAPPLAPAAEPARSALRAEAPRETRSTEDTISSDTALNLEQTDPLAEADFHMAYGLYDQAADIVKLAISREPDRRDLKLKLLEVYFVWGNKDSFLEVARDLSRTRDELAAGEWDKVVIMGRQIAGEDPLFAGASGHASDVDLDLAGDGGPAGMDLELLGEEQAPAPQPATARRASGDDLDLDLGQALGSPLDDTGKSNRLAADDLDLLLNDEHAGREVPTVEQPTLRSGTNTITFTPGGDSPTVEQPALKGGTTTREMAPRFDSPTVESPALARASSSESPTVESPALSGNTIREKIDSALFAREKGPGVGDATAELSLDDLGFDVDKLSATGTNSISIDALSVTDHPSDAPTMLAGLDERSRGLLKDAERLAATGEQTKVIGPDDATQLAPAYAGRAKAAAGASDTSETGTMQALGAGDLDLDLDELARALENDTIEQPRRDEIRFSTDVFGDHGAAAPAKTNGAGHKPEYQYSTGFADPEPTVTERINTDDLALPDLEPVTLSEVGTKLDLARAYMDMGDPDGARSILQEVLGEGSASQKQEAQRLIETLPG